jgi:hypothetical protein
MTLRSSIRMTGAALCLLLALGVAADKTFAAEEHASIDNFIGMDIGDVVRARGNITSVLRSLPRTLNKGSDVRFLDTILTGDDTRAEIVLIDDSQLSIGDNSELTIDEMVYEPGKKSRGVLTLTRGVFRMVLGKINKQDGGTLVLNTPIATIGVRGTDFWGLQEENKLTMALIDNGIVEITGADGRTVTLDTPLQAVVIERGQPTPAAPFNLTPEQLAEAAKTVTY